VSRAGRPVLDIATAIKAAHTTGSLAAALGPRKARGEPEGRGPGDSGRSAGAHQRHDFGPEADIAPGDMDLIPTPTRARGLSHRRRWPPVAQHCPALPFRRGRRGVGRVTHERLEGIEWARGLSGRGLSAVEGRPAVVVGASRRSKMTRSDLLQASGCKRWSRNPLALFIV
jgi:hypothetical protein